jgi:hypothetical protein
MRTGHWATDGRHQVENNAYRALGNKRPDTRSKLMRTGYWATDGRHQVENNAYRALGNKRPD